MSRLKILWLSTVIFIINYQNNIYPTAYGTDAGGVIVNPFNISGPDNIIRTFGCATNGFAFADAATTCSFNSVYPVAGPITFKGGTLRLQKDLILTNTGSFVDLGTIKAQNHAVDLPESVDSFVYGTQPSGAIVLNLVTRTVGAGRSIFSADWSYDGKYIALVYAAVPGGGLNIYEFTGTSLVFTTSFNMANDGNSVHWRPNSYQLATASSYVSGKIRTFRFNTSPSYSLTQLDIQNPAGTYYAVAWQGRGNYLAAGGTALRAFSVDPNGKMSTMVTPTNNASFGGSYITYDVLRWAPVGNKNNLIAGTRNGNFHLYLYDYTSATSLQHLKNYPQVTNITSLDWAPTSTYMALGFSNGTVKTYQHTAATDTIGFKSTYVGSESFATARSLSWNNNATQLAAGFSFSTSAAYPEFQILSFSTSPSYLLTRLYSIDLNAGNVSCTRYSSDGIYVMRTDDATRYLSVYKIVRSPFIFEDVKLYFMGGITLGSPLTFKGNCILNARNNLITCTGDGSINVAPNSTLNIEQTYLNFTRPNAFALQGSSSSVNFRNTWLELSADVLWGDGKFDNYEDLVVTGPHVFNYASALTSTIHSNSTLTLQKGATLQIGKSSLQSPDPLVLEDDSALLNFDNATLHVTNSGLKLTKGVINVYNQTNFIIDNLDNTQSCSLILGDSSDGSGLKDIDLLLHGNGTQLSVSDGPIILNSISPYKNQFLGQSKVSISNYCSVGIERPVDISNGFISADETTRLVFWPNSYLLCNNTHFSNPVFTKEFEDYYFTGTLTSMDSINLNTDSILSLNTGVLFQVINVIGSGNLISGFGRFIGYLNFIDSGSDVTWDVNLPIETVESISLNGGRIRFTSDSGFINDLTFKTTGTIDLGVQTFSLAPEVTTWDGKLYWVGNGATLKFNSDVTLAGSWTFSGNVVIDGNSYLLDLAPTGTIILERGASVELKNISIYNVSNRNPIICLDDNCVITLNFSDILLAGDYEFNKGSLNVYYDSDIGRLGDLDAVSTFAYTSAQTSLIESFCTLEILEGVTFSIGRQVSSIMAPESQPLTFADSTSILILNGSTLHITSSGAIFTKGMLSVTGHSKLEVENYKDEYTLIFGDGTPENDFGIDISGDGGITLNYGKIIYNNFQPNNRVVFQNPSAFFTLGAGAALKIDSDLTLDSGYIKTEAGSFFELNPAAVLIFNDVTNYSAFPYTSYKIKGRAKGLVGYYLDDGGYFYTLEGEFIGGLQCNAGNTRIGGVAGISDDIFGPIVLSGPRSTVDLSMVAPLKTDIVLNGGAIIIDSLTLFAADKKITGSGTVQLSGRQISTGTAETHMTSTIYWSCPMQGKLDLRANEVFSGNWIVDGALEINGNGNILDLSRGGQLTIRPNSTLLFNNVAVKGVGQNFGNIIWNSDNSLLKLSNSYIELENNFSTTLGGIYVNGPSCFGLGNYNWTIDKRASMTVDGVTLWRDTLDKDLSGAGRILFGAGDQSQYLSLVSSGTIKTAANLDLVEIQIGDVGADAQRQLNTIDHGPANIHFTTDSSYTLTYNLNLSPIHFLHVATNTTINGNGFEINLSNISGNQIIVDANKTVALTNAIINNFSEGAFSLGSNAKFIFGDGVVINLDLAQQLSRSWLFSGAVALGNDNFGIDLTLGGNLIVQSGGNLTLQNLSVSGLKTNNIRCQGVNATLTVKNSGLILSSNYSFTSGKIRFVGDVTVSGTNTFVYSPTNGSSGIASNSILLLDLGTTFSYAPASANRDLLGMDDETAALYINGCTLSSTTTGMRLTKGSLVVGNKNYLRNDGARSVSQGICFGNGTAGSSLYIDILAGGSIDLKSGILDYRNIN